MRKPDGPHDTAKIHTGPDDESGYRLGRYSEDIGSLTRYRIGFRAFPEFIYR